MYGKETFAAENLYTSEQIEEASRRLTGLDIGLDNRVSVSHAHNIRMNHRDRVLEFKACVHSTNDRLFAITTLSESVSPVSFVAGDRVFLVDEVDGRKISQAAKIIRAGFGRREDDPDGLRLLVLEKLDA